MARRRTDTPGRCSVCGCTEARACIGGCAWTDASRTLCSACGWISIEHLIDYAYAANPDVDVADIFWQLVELTQAERRVALS
jgi:hypothetical protein